MPVMGMATCIGATMKITMLNLANVLSNRKETKMIPVRLTSLSGNTKTINLPDRKAVETFIESFANQLSIGTAINIDAPLVGIHGGWLFGKRADDTAQ